MTTIVYTRKEWFWFLACLLLSFFFTNAAFAADVAAGSFACNAGKAVGDLYISPGDAPGSLTKTNFVSFLIWNMERLSSNIMGHMFCGMVQTLSPLVWAATTLAVLVFGISFMIGLTSLSRGGAIVFAIKIAFVTAMATQADVLIGVGYRFLITAITDGTAMVITSAAKDSKDATDVYAMMDKFVAAGFAMITDLMPAQSADPNVAGAATPCKNGIFAVLITMAFAFPLFTLLGLTLLARLVITMFRCVFGYIYALVGITFLMVMAPIFLSFYLFRSTQGFFDKWLGYLVSFTLQAILLFTFMTFVMSLNVSSLTKSLPSLIMYDSASAESSDMRVPMQYCTLCEFEVVDKSSKIKIDPGTQDFLSRGELQCSRSDVDLKVTDKFGRKPFRITTASAPDSKGQISSLLILAAQGFISLLALAWLVERLLNMVPYMAHFLGSKMGGVSPQLGGGYSPFAPTTSMPGESLVQDFGYGFQRGFGNSAGAGANSIESVTGKFGAGGSSVAQGIDRGLKTMIGGKETINRQTRDGPVATGAPNHFMRWLTDPAAFK